VTAAYIRSIRNSLKRQYAEAFARYLANGGKGPEPVRGELSYMAAQAVRLHLYNLTHQTVTNTEVTP
jgi:hypothetical protein